ncbi:MAG: hypothetical protein ABUS57_01895, partial [Pseudomonadota bacterium]
LPSTENKSLIFMVTIPARQPCTARIDQRKLNCARAAAPLAATREAREESAWAIFPPRACT